MSADHPVQVWRLPIGTRFEDFFRTQVFTKIGVCSLAGSRRKRHILRCEKSPFTKIPGPVCAAFFCAAGDVVYREGSLEVWPVAEVAA